MSPVHNHGTEDGPGLSCPERQVDGKLKGTCMDHLMDPAEAIEITLAALSDMPSEPPAKDILAAIQAGAWDEGESAGQDNAAAYQSGATVKSNPYEVTV